jgi:hypothetical protein
MANEPYKPRIFISYADADEPENPRGDETKWLSFVTGYLRPALKRGVVEIWIDRLMRGGDAWSPEIERRLRDCDIFILLVSPNSLSSDYVVDQEIAIIRGRQTKREDVHFYPLVLTPTPEAGLQLVRDLNLRPRDGRPFSDYPLSERYRHMNEAANEIAAIANEIATRKAGAQQTVRREAMQSQNEKLPLSNITINVPLHFLGRDGELAAIDAALKRDGSGVVALRGIRGVGKTTLALAYAERHKADYHATWWIRAQMDSTTRADLVSLAVGLGWTRADEKEERALAVLGGRLRDEGSGLLLVYDNAIDAASLRPYLPQGGGGACAGDLKRPRMAQHRRVGRNPRLAKRGRCGLPHRSHRAR